MIPVDTYLWRWKAFGHAIPQGGGDEGTAQDGAHVVGHDFLLLHAAVVLQGEDNRVIGRLRKQREVRTRQTFC